MQHQSDNSPSILAFDWAQVDPQFLSFCAINAFLKTLFGTTIVWQVGHRRCDQKKSPKFCENCTKGEKYVDAVPMPILEVLPLIEDIRISRVKGKTLFEMSELDSSLNYVCDYYLNMYSIREQYKY